MNNEIEEETIEYAVENIYANFINGNLKDCAKNFYSATRDHDIRDVIRLLGDYVRNDREMVKVLSNILINQFNQ